MNIREIAELPTEITEIPTGCRGVHESCFKSYQILKKVMDWLQRGVPSDVILELIGDMQENPTNAHTPL